MIGLHFGSKVAVLRCGGQWTRTKPFFVDVPLAVSAYLRVAVTLPDRYFAKHGKGIESMR